MSEQRRVTMVRHIQLALCSLALAGCGGSGGAIYEFRPTETPLQYEIRDSSVFLVKSPMGEQLFEDSVRAVVTIEIGQGDTVSHQVTAVFQSLDLWSGGDSPEQHVFGGDLIGEPFHGTLSQTGSIAVTGSPEISDQLKDLADPITLFSELLVPLPPDRTGTAEPWPHRTSYSTDAAMSTEASYDGTAYFAGDTTWNGKAARIILSEGLTTVTARGTPADAPGEVEFTYTGRSTTRYVWDPERGVMLASSATMTTEGELELLSMQMVMPISYEGSREVRLRR
jgi:hypothetical protein